MKKLGVYIIIATIALRVMVFSYPVQAYGVASYTMFSLYLTMMVKGLNIEKEYGKENAQTDKLISSQNLYQTYF